MTKPKIAVKPAVKPTPWCLEYRVTTNFSVEKFYAALKLPSASAVVKAIGIPDPQRVWYWKSSKHMPYACYLAIVDTFGRDKTGKPIPHTKPAMSVIKQPARLPKALERYVNMKELPVAATGPVTTTAKAPSSAPAVVRTPSRQAQSSSLVQSLRARLAEIDALATERALIVRLLEQHS
jgi:hypothetical protein